MNGGLGEAECLGQGLAAGGLAHDVLKDGDSLFASQCARDGCKISHRQGSSAVTRWPENDHDAMVSEQSCDHERPERLCGNEDHALCLVSQSPATRYLKQTTLAAGFSNQRQRGIDPPAEHVVRHV